MKQKKTQEEKQNPFVVDTGFDDSFYGPAFRRRKVRAFIKKQMANLLNRLRSENSAESASVKPM